MKNTLEDLNNHLFLELERLNDEDLTDEQLDKELKRSQGVANLATKIIDNAKTNIDAIKIRSEYLGQSPTRLPVMLESKNNGTKQ